MATQAAGSNSLSLRSKNSRSRGAANDYRPRRTFGRGLACLLGAAGAVASAGFVTGAPRQLSVLGVAALAGSILLFPALGTIFFFALAWANAPVVLTRESGNAVLFGAISAALLAVPAFIQIFVLKRGLVLDRPFGLMMLFLGSLLLSVFVAHDQQ